MNKVIGIVQLIVVVVFIFVSLSISGMLKTGEKKQRPKGEDRVLFAQSALITPSDYQVSFGTTGIVQARSEVNVTPEVSGRVTRVNPNFAQGGFFKKGEVLFQINPEDFALNTDQLRSNVANAQTALELEKAESAAALAEWKQLHGSLPIPDLVARKPQLEQAKANLKSARAQLQNANLDLKRSRFSMPFDGRVLSANIEKGQFVTMGQSYGSVYDLSGLEISASVNPQKMGWLLESENPNIKILVEQNGAEVEYEGVTKRGVSSIDSATRFANINFGFKEKSKSILPGSFATITAQGPSYKNVMVLPAASLQKSGIIWTLDEENILQPLEAQVIHSTDKEIVVKTDKERIKLVTSKMSGASEGVQVNTNETDGE